MFFKGMVYFCCILLSMLVTKREPAPGCNDAHSGGTQKNRKTTLSPLVRRVFLVNKRTIFFF